VECPLIRFNTGICLVFESRVLYPDAPRLKTVQDQKRAS